MIEGACAVTDRAYTSYYGNAVWERIVIMDGAMGTLIDATKKESLNIASPEIITSIHRQYLEAGADILKTNTFNSGSIHADYELNVAGARLARVIADEFTAADPSHPRFVAGAMGPAGRFFEHAQGLLEGGVDILLAETITTCSIAKAAVTAFEELFTKTGRELPVMLSVTIRESGTLLSGETLEDFWKSVSDHKLSSVGINCSFGARNLGPHIEKISGLATTAVSCHPSAGLPNASGAYDESPEETAGILREFAKHGWVDIVGGCCGTTPAHIRAIAESVRGIPHATIDLL